MALIREGEDKHPIHMICKIDQTSFFVAIPALETFYRDVRVRRPMCRAGRGTVGRRICDI